MKVLQVANVHEALPRGLNYLREEGLTRNSRNGLVLVSPVPVSTVYTSPLQRIVFYPERDYNIFFNVYESLWMLAGRNDVEPLTRYVKDFGRYANDGVLHGAYGYRWRKAFGMDQLAVIATRLRTNCEDRRSVLQMWDAKLDLQKHDHIKDVPCNDTATFQVDHNGKLNLVVFCRSNDIIWGAYFANAFHFSMLLEYMATWTGYEVGTYTQISVNYHAYVDVMQSFENIREDWDSVTAYSWIQPTSMSPLSVPDGKINLVNRDIRYVLSSVDNGFNEFIADRVYSPLMREAWHVLHAYHVYKNTTEESERRFDNAIGALRFGNPLNDWNKAAYEWIIRRRDKWRNRNQNS